MAPKHVDGTPVVVSKAFDLWKRREALESRRITIDEIIASTKLAKNTVRKFLEPNGDVSGSPLSSVAMFALYFDVKIGDVIEMQNNVSNTTADQKQKNAHDSLT